MQRDGESVQPGHQDNFKPVFKRFKRKIPPPDLSEARDYARHFRRISPPSLEAASAAELASAGLVAHPTRWEVLLGPRGIVLARNPFTPSGQRAWALRCLRDFSSGTRGGGRTNLDGVDVGVSSDEWFSVAKGTSDAKVRSKLRWATLGIHHDWDTKVYSSERTDPFPEDLGKLAAIFARILCGDDRFLAEAAIVNFYPPDSSLGPHTDHSEPDQEAPLISISLGLDAVFLFGGPTRACVPLPLLLRSGDVLVMAGEARRCFHAVPRIVQDPPERQAFEGDFEEDEEGGDPGDCRRFVASYLRANRININVRKVY